MNEKLRLAVDFLLNSKHTTAFTGAGISVESGIPPFRGENGLWNKYNPEFLEIGFFYKNPLDSWKVIKEIFYDFFGQARPNKAHEILGVFEKEGLVSAVITQNIDNLHREAGSATVYEFHGNSHTLVCTKCGLKYGIEGINLDILPPVCKKCNGLLKPDFIFFGEGIPPLAYSKSMDEAELADVFLVIGTTGEVMPACMIPDIAKQRGAKIIEINPEPSAFTYNITDVFLKGKAGEVMEKLYDLLKEVQNITHCNQI